MDKLEIIKHKLESINIFCFYALAFTLPFGFHAKNIFIIILVLIFFIKIFILEEPLIFIEKSVLIIIISYFLFHFVGLIYSDNLNKGLNNILKKLDLLIIPLLVNFNIKILKPKIFKILVSFISGLTIAILISLLFAGLKFKFYGDTSFFFYHNLSSYINQHSTYFSIQVAFASVLIILFLFTWFKNLSFLKRTSFLLLFILFQVFLFLLSSKSVIIIYCIIINFLLFYSLIRNNLRKALVWIMCFNFLFIVVLWKIPQTNSRFKEIMSINFEAVTQNQYTITTKYTALTFRATIWKFLLQSMHQCNNWILGEGTGDWQAVLEKEYVKNNVFLGIKDQRNANGFLGANAHNQYLQALLMLGVVGLLLLLLSFFVPLALAIKRKNYLFLIFITFVIFCSFTESTLETNKCILFYAFFNSLLFFSEFKPHYPLFKIT